MCEGLDQVCWQRFTKGRGLAAVTGGLGSQPCHVLPVYQRPAECRATAARATASASAGPALRGQPPSVAPFVEPRDAAASAWTGRRRSERHNASVPMRVTIDMLPAFSASLAPQLTMTVPIRLLSRPAVRGRGLLNLPTADRCRAADADRDDPRRVGPRCLFGRVPCVSPPINAHVFVPASKHNDPAPTRWCSGRRSRPISGLTVVTVRRRWSCRSGTARQSR